MQINPIEMGVFTLGQTHKTVPEPAPNFSSILSDTIYQAVDTDYANELGNEALVVGDDNSIHQTMIESSKAEMAINLTVQIRNRVVDAYNEISRMSV